MALRNPVLNKNEKNVSDLFDQFVNAGTNKTILSTFQQLCDALGLKTSDYWGVHFYKRLKCRINSWKAQSLWAKLDKRASHKDYKNREACTQTRALVIGSGPCGLRLAIELAFLGAKVVLVEKRDRFSRNNVLHLWPFLITDLKNLGAKKFFGKFCAGAIDHISIRQLQCILLKVALIMGVEIHVNTAFEELIEPPLDQSKGKIGWRCRLNPEDHPLSEYSFDVLMAADGKRNTLPGFKRKEFRGKLAIAITANFINRNTQEEVSVEEMSGVSYIYNQKFFLDLKDKTGIDLENIVYYKDATHYFVMTAKKQSLLDKGVLLQDHSDTFSLLSRQNVDQDRLLAYAREAADFSTDYKLPHLDYAVNHYGQADVAMFDFTSLFAAENASRIMDCNGHKVLMGLVGDSLLEPFWPTGSGCARGFLGAFDAAWMVRHWSMGKMSPLQLLSERESIYQLLSQTTPESLHKNHNDFSIDPNTRYPNLNTSFYKPQQVRHLYDCDDKTVIEDMLEVPAKRPRQDVLDTYTMLCWCQRVLNTGTYRNVNIVDFTSSWKSGLALCALIHVFKPDLIDIDSLVESDIVRTNQIAFDVAEKELSIPPVMTGEDMANCDLPDKLTVVSYLAQFYELFKKEKIPHEEILPSISIDDPTKSLKSPTRRISLLNRLSNRLSRSKKPKKSEEEENENSLSLSFNKGYKRFPEKSTWGNGRVQLTNYNKLPMEEIANKLNVDRKEELRHKVLIPDMQGNVKVSAMADLLLAKFKGIEQPPSQANKMKSQGFGLLSGAQPASEFCYFCKKRIYIMERNSAEGVFFHKDCLQCDTCGIRLRPTNYTVERIDTGGVKFFCNHHILPETRVKLRKRHYRDVLDKKENVPEIVVDKSEPPAKITPEKQKTKSPKKIPSPLPTPIQLPESAFAKAKKTPERIEFENSIDGLEEESEEEQTEHNLRSSLSSDTLLDISSDSDLWDEYSDEELELILSQWSSDEGSDLEEAVNEAVHFKSKKSFEKLLDAVENEQYRRLDGDDSEEEDTEVEDSEYDSEDDSDSISNNAENVNGLHPKTSSPPLSPAVQNIDSLSPINTPNSPSKVFAARSKFFDCQPEVVRLDYKKALGLEERPEKKQEESVEDVVMDGINEEHDQGAEDIVAETETKENITEPADEYSESEITDDSDSGTEIEDYDVEEVMEEEDLGSEDEMKNEKEAVSKAMELLLADIDKKKSIDGDEVESSEMSDEDNDNVFIEEKKNSESNSEKEITKETVLDSIKRMDESSASGGDTLQAVLASVKAMDESPSDEKDSAIKLLDDKFITKRRERGSENVKRGSNGKKNGSGSSFTISTPSESSLSSESSMDEFVGKNPSFLKDDDDDDKPDEEMLLNYQNTLSMVLDEDNDLEVEVDNDAAIVEEYKTGSTDSRKQLNSVITSEEEVESIEVFTIKHPKQSIVSEEEEVEVTETYEVFVKDPFLEHKEHSNGCLASNAVQSEGENESEEEVETVETYVIMKDVLPTIKISQNSLCDDSTDGINEIDVEHKKVSLLHSENDCSVYHTPNSSLVEEESSPKIEKSSYFKRAEKLDSNKNTHENSAFSWQTNNAYTPKILEDKKLLEPKLSIDEFFTPAACKDDVVTEEKISRQTLSKLNWIANSSYVSVKSETAQDSDENKQSAWQENKSYIPQHNKELICFESDASASVQNDLEDKNNLLVITSDNDQNKEDPVMFENRTYRSEEPVKFTNKSFSEITNPSVDSNSQIGSGIPNGFSHHTGKNNSVDLDSLPESSVDSAINICDISEPEQILPANSDSSSVSSSVRTARSSSREPSSTPSISSVEEVFPTSHKNRKLPELSHLKTKNESSVVFQSKFMSEQLGKPYQNSAKKPYSAKSSRTKRITPLSLAEKMNTPSFSSSDRESSVEKTSSQQSSSKYKVPVDKSHIVSDSIGSSNSETPGYKKRIPVDKELYLNTPSNLGKSIISDNDDIPFADETEDEGLREKFFTPKTSIKQKPPTGKTQKPVAQNVRKRILPIPPISTTSPIKQSAEKMKQIQLPEAKKPRDKASNKARLVSNENSGMKNDIYSSKTVSADKRRVERQEISTSSQYDTPSTSDLISDSDDSRFYNSSTTSPSTKSNDSLSSVKGVNNTKFYIKSPKISDQSDRSDEERTSKLDKKEKKRSIFSKLIPSKTGEKAASKDCSSPKHMNDTPPKKSTPKSDKKKEKKKKKKKPSKLLGNISDNMRELKIGSVFYVDNNNGHSLKKNPLASIAPTADVDEFSDSGESHVSTDTLSRRQRNAEDLEARLARKVQQAAKKQQKQREQKRLRMAQAIQRQLEEVDVKQRELEDRGITVEKALRGDGPDADKDEAGLMQEWFNLVHEKNDLVRYESELMVHAKELELEDRQCRLEQSLRDRMSVSDDDPFVDTCKTDRQIAEEKKILEELLVVVEQRDSLVAMLEEDRLREREEDKDLESMMLAKGFELSPLTKTNNEFFAE